MTMTVKSNIKLTAYSLLLISSALLISSCSKNSNQEGLAKAVFRALKSNNFEHYAKYVIRENEINTILTELKKSTIYHDYSAIKTKYYTEIITHLKLLHTKNKIKLKQNFNDTFDFGVRKGITWSKTRFVKALIDRETSLYDIKDIVQQNIFIVFSYNKKNYKIRLKNTIKLSRGWVIVDGFSWETLAK